MRNRGSGRRWSHPSPSRRAPHLRHQWAAVRSIGRVLGGRRRRYRTLRRPEAHPSLDTAELCADAGLCFVPFGFEAEGGFGREAREVLAGLARDSARLTGEGHATRAAMAAQALSVTLQRANAHAIARML